MMKAARNLIIALALSGPALADAGAGPYSLAAAVPWQPKNSTSCDQGAVFNGTYYLSDRFNGVVHVVDLATATEITRIGGFVGLSFVNGSVDKPTSGPAGIIPIPDLNELWAGDGDGTVKVIDLFTNTIVDIIHLDLKKRADEMAYDPTTKVAAVTGADEDIPIVFFISVTNRQVLGNITFPNATNGIEQPTWNPTDGKFYLSVPESVANLGGEVDVLDQTTFEVIRVLPEPQCNSAGIVFGLSQQLLLGCSQDSINSFNVSNTLIMDVTTGDITATINGVAGGDQVAYDSSTNFFFVADYKMLAGGLSTGDPDPLLAIIDAKTGTLVQTIPTDNVTAHSVAVDPKTNKMIVPVTDIGIAVFDLKNSTSTETTTTTTTPPGPTANVSVTGHPTPSTIQTSEARGSALLSMFAYVVGAVIAVIV